MGRTSKNIKLRIPEKPRKIKGFRTGSYRVATTISSQARYDHFDTLPYKNTQPNCIQSTRTILYQILDRFSSITFTGFCIHCVGLSMMCYRFGKEKRTCFGERQLRGLIGKLLYWRWRTASCFWKS